MAKDNTFTVVNYGKYAAEFQNCIGRCPVFCLREKNSNGTYRVAYDPKNDCYVCVSYETVVSYCPAGTKEVTRLGHWSVTTSKHQTKFERWVAENL